MTTPATHRSDFKVTKTQCHGFHENPSCLAYDSIQKLLAIGSYNGEVIIIGRPGLETRFEIPSGTAIHQMQFCINKGLMLVYCSDSKCYLWSIRTNIPQLLFQIQLPSKDKLTVLYWPYNSSTAYAGTDKGNIYFIYVDWQEHHQSQCSCNISAQLYWCEEIVYWNKVVISSKGFHRDHPGEITSIEEHPLEPEKILVAYSLGLCIVWNLKNKEVEYRHQHDSMECAYWYGGNGKKYTIAYTSGKITGMTLKKYNEKDTETVKKNDEKILYECPEIGTVNRLQCYNIKQWKWLVFILSAVSGSKIENRVVISGKKGLVTNLLIDQSIIDCMCISTSPFKAERQHPKALVVLQENKLEVFDIQSDPVPLRPLPFCNPFSFGYMSSPITFLHHGGSCFSQTIVDCLTVLKAKFCHQKRNEQTSSQPWPFDGEQTWNPSVKKECLPEIIVTSHADQRGSIKLWLCYPDILEYLFCIDTAELFPVSYRTSEAISLEPVSLSRTESGDSKSDDSKEPEEDVKQKPCPNDGATLSSDEMKEESDVKFVNINMEQQTIVFVNRRGNVLVFKLCLQPPHESPKSKEILLNSAEEVDGVSQDNEAMLGWRFWYGHPSEDTLRVHLLYHTYCVVQWEASMRVVSVEAAVYNDAIKMLSLGTRIAIVLVDTQCNGTIIIDTLKTLKSLGMSSISSCETRTVVESKPRKFNLVSKVKKIGKSKEERMSHPVSNDVHPCCSSVVDVVFFALDRNQPSRTLWIGTNSGELAIFHISRQSSDTNHLQLKPTEISIQQKHSITNLIFLTKEFEKIHSCSLWVCRMPENGDTQDDDMILNYVVVETKKTLQCFGFPNKRTVPIGKYKIDTNKEEILRTTFINCKGQPCLLSILSQGELLFSSIPDLHSLTKISEPSLMKKSVLDTLNFVESGEGIYVSLPTKLQRLLVSKGNVEETDSPVSVDCNPQSYVPHHGPVAAGIKIGFKNTTTLHGSINRDAWFTPRKSVVTTRRLAHDRTSSTETDGSKNESKSLPVDQNNPFQRTALALNERGDRLNEAVETTRNLAEAAELYEEYVEKQLKRKK